MFSSKLPEARRKEVGCGRKGVEGGIEGVEGGREYPAVHPLPAGWSLVSLTSSSPNNKFLVSDRSIININLFTFIFWN